LESLSKNNKYNNDIEKEDIIILNEEGDVNPSEQWIKNVEKRLLVIKLKNINK